MPSHRHSKKTSTTVGKKSDDPGRLSKRLCYLLRYGAIKEGLTVYDGGFVDIKELMGVSMMRHHSEEEVLEEIESSLSHRKTQRFEQKQDGAGRTLVRAKFCRNFEPSTVHEGSGVPTMFHLCLTSVASHLQDFDLEDFPDEFIISSMISHLKRKKKLTVSNLKQLLVPALEHLDLSDTYITESVFKSLYKNCPNIRFLSLKDCGYIVTDDVVETLIKKLPALESLSLAACKHVTDRGIRAICKRGKNLRQLNLSWIRGLADSTLLDLVVNCEKLEYLDIYDLKVGEDTRLVMVEAARQRGIKIVLEGLNESNPDVTTENPSMMLPNFGKVF